MSGARHTGVFEVAQGRTSPELCMMTPVLVCRRTAPADPAAPARTELIRLLFRYAAPPEREKKKVEDVTSGSTRQFHESIKLLVAPMAP